MLILILHVFSSVSGQSRMPIKRKRVSNGDVAAMLWTIDGRLRNIEISMYGKATTVVQTRMSPPAEVVTLVCRQEEEDAKRTRRERRERAGEELSRRTEAMYRAIESTFREEDLAVQRSLEVDEPLTQD